MKHTAEIGICTPIMHLTHHEPFETMASVGGISIDIYKELNTETKRLIFLENMRWPDGVKCLACNSDHITRITAKGKLNKKSGKRSPDRELYQCNECRFQFTATTGTVYHDTHLPLSKWFLAIALITESKKGISANQLARALGVQYRTAWHLAHRIRKAMIDANPPKLSGIVEIDETYIGGKQRGHRGKLKNKDVVIGVRERGGPVRLVQTPDNKQTPYIRSSRITSRKTRKPS